MPIFLYYIYNYYSFWHLSKILKIVYKTRFDISFLVYVWDPLQYNESVESRTFLPLLEAKSGGRKTVSFSHMKRTGKRWLLKCKMNQKLGKWWNHWLVNNHVKTIKSKNTHSCHTKKRVDTNFLESSFSSINNRFADN